MTRVSERHPAPASGRLRVAAFQLTESKLNVPAARPGIVPRAALVDRLLTTETATVVSVVAPPGYGKSTLLAQWAHRRGRRVAWISVDDRDNDPVVLLTYLAAALDRIEPLDPTIFRVLASSGGEITVPRLLIAAIAAMEQPVALVLDHLEAVTNQACLDAVAALALGVPAGSQLAIGSRDPLPLPTARLRAEGGIVEIEAQDLAMDGPEAAVLFEEAGVALAEAERVELVRRTEGWPAGLYLAALAVRVGGLHGDIGATFTGDDRYMGDYLRSELLDRVSPAEVSFVTRTSILDRMSGPLCDAVLDARHSSEVLEALERRNLLVMPLDRHRGWYRYHHLFRELLASELQRREPETVADLHLRAARWYEAQEMPEAAIGHAQAAGDADRVARLVLRVANPVWASGRATTLTRWMEWFETQGVIEQHPGIAVHGALMLALVGRPGGTERWALAAERTTETGLLPDGNTIEATVAYMRALLCRDGIETMRRDARVALDGLSPNSPYRATMVFAEGVADLLDGDADRADATLARAVDLASRAGVAPFVPVLLVERGLAAIARGDWRAVRDLADEVEAMMEDGQFGDYWTSALVYAWIARTAVQRGDLAAGKRHVARAARLRPLLNYALPIVSLQALLEMARAYIALADTGGARAVLRQANDILRQRPALDSLAAQAAGLRAELDTVAAGALRASALTTAELRLMPFLPTHLSFREIGERLYVSRHTVKTQAISIYRKLGASSRSETITRMQELGLLDHA